MTIKNNSRKFIYLILTAMLVLAAVACFAFPSMGKYTSRVVQSFDLRIHPTKPILAEKNTWYRGATDMSEIKTIAFVDADYLPNNPDLLSDSSFVEAFYADVKNIGTIQCFVIKDANDEKGIIISGNRYEESNDIFANVDSSELFSGFTGLTEISSANQLNVTNVTDFSDAFADCSLLMDIGGLGSWTTDSATNMSGMFDGCSALTSLSLTNFNTENVTTTADMFKACERLRSLDLSAFDTSSVTDMSGMFDGMTALNQLVLGNGFTTASVTDFSGMFRETEALSAVDVSGFNTSSATTMEEMFADSAVQSLNLSSWNTSSVTNMKGMFTGCAVLENAQASQNFAVSNVTLSLDMFKDCTSIFGEHGTIYNSLFTDKTYARIDTTNFHGYFHGNTITITFDTNGGTGSLSSQYVLPNVDDTLVSEGGALSKSHFFFDGWNTQADGNGTSYADGATVNFAENTTLYAVWTADEATFLSGSDFNIAVKTLAGATSPTAGTANSTVTAISQSAAAPAEGTTTATVSSSGSNRPIIAWLDGTTLKYYTEAETIYLNENAGYMLRKFTALASVDCTNWNTSRTTNMTYLFAETSALQSIDLSTWDTSSVTAFTYMFLNSGVTSLDLSSFDTSSATIIGGMFENCRYLTSVNVSSFDTSNVTNMVCMFSTCTSLTSINISNFTTESLTGCRFMFRNCRSLTTIYASSDFDVSSVGSTTGMFIECTSLVGSAGTIYDANNVDGAYAHIDSTTNPGYFTGSTKRIVFHSGLTPDTTRTQFVLPDTSDILLPNSFIKTGYSFTNWATSADSTGTTYSAGALITRTSSDADVLDLYAQWSENTYTVTMNDNGTETTGSRLFTASYSLPASSSMTRTGYTFGGWYESSSFSGTAITSISANTAENKTVYAKWTENSYTITYNYNGGTCNPAPSTTRLYTQSVNLPAAGVISKTGYKFGGWYENSDFSGSAEASISANTAQNLTFYAKWTPITYTVRFNSNGGRANAARYISAITATYGQDFTLPEMNDRFERTGYSFSGYDLSMTAKIPTYTENSTARDLTDVDGATVTLYCIWSYDISVWDIGQNINARLKSLVSAGATYNSVDNTIEHFVRSETAPDSSITKVTISRSDSAGMTYAWFDSATSTVYWYSSSANIYIGKDSSYIFSNMAALEDIDLSTVQCKNIRSYLTNYSTLNSLSHAFDGCTSLENAPFGEFDDLSTVTDISYMFKNCTSLDGTAIPSVTLPAVTTMEGIFEGNGASSFNLSPINAVNCTNLSRMLKNCTSLTAINFGTFATANATNMSEMFSGCALLQTLSLNTFDTSNVTNSANMFAGMDSLERISYTKSFTLTSNLPTPDSNNISGADGNWYKSNGTGYAVANLPDHGTFYAKNSFTYATFISGASFNVKIKTLAAGRAVTGSGNEDRNITAIMRSTAAPLGVLNTDYICVSATAPANDTTHYYDYPIYAWFDNSTGIIYYYSQADILFFNSISTDMFYSLRNCTAIDLSSIDTSHTKGFGFMFGGCGVLNNIDVSNFDTSNATDMQWMFYNCSKLTSIDLSGFDTSNVTTMSKMFNACSALTSLDVSGFDTANVTNMSYMFNGCSALTSLDVSGFDTANVTNMSYMFYNCSGLTSLDVSGFDTSKVTSMAFMFSGCSGLTSLDVSNFDTSKVTSMSYMFYQCSKLTSLDVSNFDTSKVTNMSYMFNGCSGLTSLDVSGFDTANVTSMAFMFSSCSGLTSLDVSRFNTEKVTAIRYMFYNCSNLTSLDVSGFDTARVTDFGNMFQICNKLTSIDVSGFNTSSAENIQAMFYGCSGITTLDLSSFDTSNVTKMMSLFQNCTNLQTIYASNRFVTTGVTVAADYANIFTGCSSLVGGNGTAFAATNKTGKEYARLDLDGQPGYFTAKLATLFDGESFNATLKTLVAGTPKTATDTDSTVTAICRSAAAPTGSTVAVSPAGDIVVWFDSATNTIYWYSDATMTHFNADCSGMFAGFTALERVDMGWCDEDVTTEDITDISEMFKGCTSLADVYMNEMDTSNVTDMHGLFEGCTALVNLSMGDIRTQSVTNMSRMFYGCAALTRLNIWGFNTANVTNCSDIFTGMTNLHEVDVAAGMQGAVQTALYNLKPWYTNLDLTQTYTTNLTAGTTMQVTSATQMTKGAFYDHSTLTTARIGGDVNSAMKNLARVANSLAAISVDRYDTYILCLRRSMTPAPAAANTASFGTNITGWYDNGTIWYYTSSDQVIAPNNVLLHTMTKIRSADLSGWNTSSLTTMNCYINTCESLRSLDTSGFDTHRVTNLNQVFFRCMSLKDIDVSGWDTGNVTNMSQTFAGCSKLTSLDISGWDTGNVTTLASTFQNCSALTSLDLSGWDTGNVTTLASTFQNCSALTSLDLSGWDTHNVKNMQSTFRDCTALTSLDVSGWDTGNVTTMQSTFEGCTSLASLDMSSNDTHSLISLYRTFYACSALTSLDLSDWDTGNVTTLYYTFAYCTNLTSLDVSRWDTGNVTNMNATFCYCSKLTSLDLSGWDTGNVTTLSGTFYGCSALTSLDVSGWDTGNVTNMYATFFKCSKLTSLDVSNWDTGNVTNMQQTFEGCTSLASLDMSSNDTHSLISLYRTFYGCTALTSLDLSDWDTGNVTSLYYTFYNCSALTSLDVSGWDTGNVTTMQCTFGICSSLTSLDLSDWDTGNVTILTNTFYSCRGLVNLDLSGWDTGNVTNMYQTFYGCSSLTSLDLSDWDTGNVTNMPSTFAYCSKLKSIYASDSFVTAAVTNSGSMFIGCYQLVGENGTVYSASKVIKTYACIDNPADGKPGYFSRNATYTISYFDSAYTGTTESYFLADYQQGGANEAQIPHTRKLSQTVTLPTAEMMSAPEGKTLDGWLERTDIGWSNTPIYTIAQGERGNYELTPNWVDEE